MLFFKSRGPDFLKQIENGNNTANPKLKSEFCEKDKLDVLFYKIK